MTSIKNIPLSVEDKYVHCHITVVGWGWGGWVGSCQSVPFNGRLSSGPLIPRVFFIILFALLVATTGDGSNLKIIYEYFPSCVIQVFSSGLVYLVGASWGSKRPGDSNPWPDPHSKASVFLPCKAAGVQTFRCVHLPICLLVKNKSCFFSSSFWGVCGG